MSNISKLTDLLSYNEFAQVHDKLQPHQLLASEGNSGTHSAAALHPFPWNSPREWRVRLLRVQVSFVPEIFTVSTVVLKKIFTMHWKFSEVKRKHFIIQVSCSLYKEMIFLYSKHSLKLVFKFNNAVLFDNISNTPLFSP